jgi:hypothetical protein
VVLPHRQHVIDHHLDMTRAILEATDLALISVIVTRMRYGSDDKACFG